MTDPRFRRGRRRSLDRRPGPGKPRYPLGAYTGIVSRAQIDMMRREALLAAERASASARLRELLEHPPARRRMLLGEHPRFRTYALAEHLLATCRSTWSDDPAHAEELARLAVSVADAMEAAESVNIPVPVLHDLRAEGWSYVANCRRIRSDLRAVPEAFRAARGHLARGTGAPEDEVAVLDLEASYLIDQRRFEAAERTLERVISIYGKAGDRHMQGRAMMKLARLRWEEGRPGEAVPLFEQAAGRIDPIREPHLEVIVKRGLVLSMADAGRADEARTLLPELRRMARKLGSRPENLRVLWTQGLVYHHLGHHALAAEAIAQARDGFAAESIGYDAALATLDLALVHLDAGDPESAFALAADLPPLFAARDVDREAAAALAVVHRAMEEQTLTREIVRRAAVRLRRR
jgi:tetratricopeptide (TPR) repeat protein